MRPTIILWCVLAAAAPTVDSGAAAIHELAAPAAAQQSANDAAANALPSGPDGSAAAPADTPSNIEHENENDNEHEHDHEHSDNMDHSDTPTDSHSNGHGSHADGMPPSPMTMDHHHGRPALEDPNLEPQQRKYWEQYNTTTFFSAAEGNKVTLWAHALLSFVAFGMLTPITAILSNDRAGQWLFVPVHTVQTALGALSILFLWMYAPTAPALYPHNAYAPFSVAMFVLICAHWLFMIVRAISGYMQQGGAARYEYAGIGGADDEEEGAGFALDDLADERHESSSSTEFGSDTDQASLDGGIPPPLPKPDFEPAPQTSGLVQRLAQNSVFARLNRAIGGVASLLFAVLNYPMFFVSWAYLLTGLATAFVMGKGHYVFALLAHFIKGFVFILLGFVELSRYFGAGATSGWGWNELYLAPSPHLRARSRLSKLRFWPENASIEYWQCFLIFFYGATNVFLEHLGNNDGKWSHKDLQHASIAFMFFGGGLCGMTLESATLKRSLANAFRTTSRERVGGELRRGWSLNPMPAFIIFWTGALMSHHEQETPLSTAIHVQWGYLFSLAAVVRLVTLGLLYTRPRVTSHAEAALPQKPFTEVLVAFCLVCGGMIFMGSNRESVEGMIYRGMDQMFTLNVSVGVTVILMAYFTGCLAVKGWAASRY